MDNADSLYIVPISCVLASVLKNQTDMCFAQLPALYLNISILAL